MSTAAMGPSIRIVVSVVKSQHQCILEQTNAIVVDFCDWEKNGGFSAANVVVF
jgi:hypothetical protein